MTFRRIVAHFFFFLTVAICGVSLCVAQSSSRARTVHKKAKRKPSRRTLRVHQAFVASKDLRPMAQQLLRERTLAGEGLPIRTIKRLHR